MDVLMVIACRGCLRIRALPRRSLLGEQPLVFGVDQVPSCSVIVPHATAQQLYTQTQSHPSLSLPDILLLTRKLPSQSFRFSPSADRRGVSSGQLPTSPSHFLQPPKSKCTYFLCTTTFLCTHTLAHLHPPTRHLTSRIPNISHSLTFWCLIAHSTPTRIRCS
jgi:hypothetical protein